MAKFCSNCGSELTKGSSFCSSCGSKIATDKETVETPVEETEYSNTNENAEAYTYSDPNNNYLGESTRNRWVAGILGIVFCSFGVHSFYLGYTGRGFAQLFVTFFTCGLGSIWGFIEGILILAGSINTDAEGRKLSE